jgi:hypothetical protein
VQVVYQKSFSLSLSLLFFSLVTKSANVEVDLQSVLVHSEMERKMERLMSSPFIHRLVQDQINFKALMGFLMFPSFALQSYSNLYGTLSISS